MPVRFEAFITRRMLRENPDTLFVFGDNFAQRGYGGQAKEMRGEPNAVGIPTKQSPYRYLENSDIGIFIRISAPTWMRLIEHLEENGTIIWPSDGIGTGLAQLNKRAPLINRYIQEMLNILKQIDGVET